MKERWAQLKEGWRNHSGGWSESERAWRMFAAFLVALAIVAVPVWWVGYPWWKRWQQEKALAQVAVFSEANDYRSASLALQRAIKLGPADPTTWREAVRLLGEMGSPEVLQAHEQLARLAPDDPSVQLAWVRDALRFEAADQAQETLDGIAEAARRDAAFHRLAAALALSSGRSAEVEKNLEALLATAPNDASARFNLAAVRLWSADEAKRAEGRAELQRMAGEKTVGVRAALELLKAAAREHDEQRMRETLTLLQTKYVPGWRADFPDAGQAGVVRLIEQLKAAAAEEDAHSVAVLARWLAAAGQRRETLLWVESLRPELGASKEVADVAAEISAELGDLDRLETYLRAGAWGVWPRDVLTLAMASRLQRLRYGETQARATWNDAIRATEGSVGALKALVRLADVWGDAEGAERALQEFAKEQPGNFWAYDALRTMYVGRGELARLWDLQADWVRRHPDAEEATISWIVLGSILGRLDQAAVQRAEELAAAERPEALIALAAVRWRKGKPQEALRVLERLPEGIRDEPAALFWRGLAAAELRQGEVAAPALRKAARSGLSAEEGRLLREAAERVNVSLDAS